MPLTKSVVFIDDKIKGEGEEPVVFTHYYAKLKKVARNDCSPNEYDKVIYLGRCSFDGDMFAAYGDNIIDIFGGNLNSGKY